MLMNSRRQFLSFVAASPLWLRAQDGAESPKDMLNIMDFEAPARKKIPIAHWAYMATGVDDDTTLHANHEAFTKIHLRPRRLVDVRNVDTSVELFGVKWDSPIYISACGSQKAFHPEGELATARAAKAKHACQMLSTVSSTSVEDVAGALGHPPWYQMYAPPFLAGVEQVVRRVEKVGCSVLFLTVDVVPGRNTETQRRLSKGDTRQCSACHGERGPGDNSRRPMNQGLDRTGPPTVQTWEFVDRLKKMTSMKVVVKGLLTKEDAELAVEHGADGVVCSNHGGRAMDDGRASIDALPEVLAGARGRIPVLFDSGVRRGSDAFKALALGAKAVGIGRPYLWGLGSFGQEGVERVLDILNAELKLTMRQCGTRSVGEIGKGYLV